MKECRSDSPREETDNTLTSDAVRYQGNAAHAGDDARTQVGHGKPTGSNVHDVLNNTSNDLRSRSRRYLTVLNHLGDFTTTDVCSRFWFHI